MAKNLYIFDLDGTLLDTSEGIINSYKYIMTELKLKSTTESTFRSFIGGSLFNNIKNHFELTDTETQNAIEMYRERYAEKGIYEYALYPNLVSTLKKIKKAGHCIAIATLKYEGFAKVMMKDIGISEEFDYISGMDKEDTISKEDMISKCSLILENKYDGNVVMIGDSIKDYDAAVIAKVDFIGVTYGFGITYDTKYNKTRPLGVINQFIDLENFI